MKLENTEHTFTVELRKSVLESLPKGDRAQRRDEAETCARPRDNQEIGDKGLAIVRINQSRFYTN